MMTKEEARTILSGYVKACREDDMLTLETFGYEDVMEAMSMGAKALQQPSLSSDLEEAAEKYASGFPFDNEWQSIANNAFIAGAGWMAKQQPLPEDSVAFQKGVQEGRRLEREDIKSIIQSRIDEILGDAQPNPILRMELQELIKKIEL